MSEKFWNRFANRYASQPIKDQASYDQKLHLTRGVLSPQSKVLEIACGTGSTAIALAPDAAEIIAIDSSSRMIEIAQAKLGSLQNVSFVHSEIATFQGAEFDAVLAHSILHLLPNWRDAISDAFNRLNSGGVFISSTYCVDKAPWMLRLLLPLGSRINLMPSLQVFTQAELETCLQGAGFDLEKIWNPGDGKTAFIIARKPD